MPKCCVRPSAAAARASPERLLEGGASQPMAPLRRGVDRRHRHLALRTPLLEGGAWDHIRRRASRSWLGNVIQIMVHSRPQRQQTTATPGISRYPATPRPVPATMSHTHTVSTTCRTPTRRDRESAGLHRTHALGLAAQAPLKLHSTSSNTSPARRRSTRNLCAPIETRA